MSGCGPSLPVSNGAASVAPPVGWSTAYEIDFGAQGNVDPLVNGQQVMADGSSWTIATAGAATFRMRANNGIEFGASAANTAWNNAPAFTASVLWISLNDPTLPAAQRLLPSYDIHRQYVFQVHNTVNTGNASNEIVNFNLWAPAAVPYSTATDRMAGVCKGGNATVASGTGSVAQAAAAQLMGSYSGDDVICLAPCVAQPSAVGCSSGVYDAVNGVWPAMSALHECGWISATGLPVAANSASRFNDPSMRLAIAFPTGNATGTFSATVRRLRVLVWG